jgi:hypothetical protein
MAATTVFIALIIFQSLHGLQHRPFCHTLVARPWSNIAELHAVPDDMIGGDCDAHLLASGFQPDASRPGIFQPDRASSCP